MSPGHPYVTAFLSVFSQYLVFLCIGLCLHSCLHGSTRVPMGMGMPVHGGCRLSSPQLLPTLFCFSLSGGGFHVLWFTCGGLNWIQVIGLSGKYLYTLSHLSSPRPFHLKLRKKCLCIWMICLHVYLCTTCIVGAHGSLKRVVASRETRVTDSCICPFECWGSNPRKTANTTNFRAITPGTYFF